MSVDFSAADQDRPLGTWSLFVTITMERGS